MPITYRVDDERRLVLTTAHGELTQQELQTYVGMVLSDSDIQPGFDELGDLTLVTRVNVSTADIIRVADAIGEVGRHVKETKTALVAPDRIVEEISTLYELFRTSVPATVKLFPSMTEARAWLGLPAEHPRERRAARRKKVQFRVLCRSGLQERFAQIVDISVSGARIRCVSVRPAVGAIVKMRSVGPDVDIPTELTSSVVRHTQLGFAVQFIKVPDGFRQLLGDLP